MPNIASAKKRLRQSLVRRAKNRAVKSALKTECKKVVAALKDGSVEKAEGEFRTAAKKLDQAASKGVIHRNAAARTKSRLSAKIRTAKGKPPRQA
jgi:small subunit ribosomal protein S20